jgi:hypothetical protein
LQQHCSGPRFTVQQQCRSSTCDTRQQQGPAVTSFVKLMHFFQAFHCPKPAAVALPQPMARPFSLKLVSYGHPARYVSTLLQKCCCFAS